MHIRRKIRAKRSIYIFHTFIDKFSNKKTIFFRVVRFHSWKRYDNTIFWCCCVCCLFCVSADNSFWLIIDNLCELFFGLGLTHSWWIYLFFFPRKYCRMQRYWMFSSFRQFDFWNAKKRTNCLFMQFKTTNRVGNIIWLRLEIFRIKSTEWNLIEN